MVRYHNTVSEIVEMFTDRTAGESTTHNRLITRETDNGDVALIAYGWLKIAQYDEERGVVTVFTGHKNIESQTVNEYTNKVIETARDRGRTVSVVGESPTCGQPNGETQFINNYVTFGGNMSAVERDAQQSVIESLAHLA
jgi:hypothetical protein